MMLVGEGKENEREDTSGLSQRVVSSESIR